LERYLELLYGGGASERSEGAPTAPKIRTGEKSEITQETSALISLNSLISHPAISVGEGLCANADAASLPEGASPDTDEAAVTASVGGGEPPNGPCPPSEAVQKRAALANNVVPKAAAGDVGAHPELPPAVSRRRWVDAANEIDRVLGRHQRGDISRRRWQQMRVDVRGFVEAGWAHRAVRLGWHVLELLGVDRRCLVHDMIVAAWR
jgi:hypothetical protein